jgi:hypothetical protein
MTFWDSIKKDIKKGLDEGIHVMKEGTATFIERAEALAEEGKKRIKEFEIKQKIQVQLTELGGKVHDLLEKNVKSPTTHPSVKSILKKIENLKDQLVKAEEKAKPKAKAKKKTAQKKTVKKKAASKKKTAQKKTAVKKKTV